MTRIAVRDHAFEFMDEEQARAIEDTLWWMVGRESILRQFLDHARALAPIDKVLEVGCGSGGNFRLLAEYGEVVGCERSQVLADRARARGIASEVYAEDFFDLDISYDADLTCLFDVLEHIEDDALFLRRLAGRTRPGHRLLLSVPACNWLYSKHDELLHHFRRYSRGGLEALLRANGFTVHRSSYFLFSLFPAVALARLGAKLLAHLSIEQHEVHNGAVRPWLNYILLQIVRAEAALARFIRFPIGVWVIVLAEKS